MSLPASQLLVASHPPSMTHLSLELKPSRVGHPLPKLVHCPMSSLSWVLGCWSYQKS